eukprot:SAG31_NODE_6501_length_1994_cov_1.790501_1_plen_343_part_00
MALFFARTPACRINAVREKLCLNVCGVKNPRDDPSFAARVAKFYSKRRSFGYATPLLPPQSVEPKNAPSTFVETATAFGAATAVFCVGQGIHIAGVSHANGAVLTGFSSGTVALYSHRRKRLWSVERAHCGAVLGFEVVKTTKSTVCSADSTGRVLVWLPGTATQPFCAIECVSFPPRVVPTSTFQPELFLNADNTNSVSGPINCFCVFRRHIVLGGADGYVRLWTTSGQLDRTLLPVEFHAPMASRAVHATRSQMLCVASCDDRVAAVSREGTLLVWEPHCSADRVTHSCSASVEVQPQLRLERGHPSWVSQRCWSLAFEGALRLWCGLENGCVVLMQLCE